MKRRNSNMAAGLILVCSVAIAAVIVLVFGGGRKTAPQPEAVSAVAENASTEAAAGENIETESDQNSETETETETKIEAESETAAEPESSAAEQGWQQKNGTWYYYDEQGEPVTGWLDWQGKRYYLQEDGSMKTGFWEISSEPVTTYNLYEGVFGKDGEGYYFLEDGSMFTGDIIIYWEGANEYNQLEQYAKELGIMSVDLNSEMGRGLTTPRSMLAEAGYTFHEDGTFRYWSVISE